MLGKEGVDDVFKLLNFDCVAIIFRNLSPIDIIRCGQASRTLREWSLWFMSSDGLRRRHFPYFTDEDSLGNDTLSPIERYTRFTQIQGSFRKGKPSSVVKFVAAKALKTRGNYSAWIFGSWVCYHQLRNRPGDKFCCQIQPLRKFPLPVFPPSRRYAPYAPHFIDVNAEGYLFVRVGIEEWCSRRIKSNHDMIFSPEHTKLLWHHYRALHGLPELQPLHIGRQRVYYVTMFSKPELIAYDIRTGRQLYRSTLPEKVNNKSHYPQFYLIFDMDSEFLAYVSRDLSLSSQFIYVVLVSGADGRVSQEIEVSDVSWTLEFKEQPDLTAFALERRKQSIANAKYDLIIFEKYALQPDGLFAMTSRHSFLLDIIASPDRTFIYVDPFRLLAFAMIDATSDFTIPRVLEPRKLSDTNILSEVEAALREKGPDERIDNWFTLSASSYITLPPKAAGSKTRRPLKVRGIDTHLASKVSFWGERGILFHVSCFRPGNSDARYALDFTPNTYQHEKRGESS
ncbi:hypothetical protein EMPG_11787 [Blastomyces silverae]|uniref:F-box domain-containing protein n=1 Tax=Blastomyces silverae TaxID=2060906 RepID=A0A0H1BPH9_9EURO|nr:hypothetical protein EMPG_11787 [Blastomyces silverae]